MAKLNMRGVSVKGFANGEMVVDLDIDRSELLAGAVERGYTVRHEGHDHRVISVDPPDADARGVWWDSTSLIKRIAASICDLPDLPKSSAGIMPPSTVAEPEGAEGIGS